MWIGHFHVRRLADTLPNLASLGIPETKRKSTNYKDKEHTESRIYTTDQDEIGHESIEESHHHSLTPNSTRKMKFDQEYSRKNIWNSKKALKQRKKGSTQSSRHLFRQRSTNEQEQGDYTLWNKITLWFCKKHENAKIECTVLSIKYFFHDIWVLLRQNASLFALVVLYFCGLSRVDVIRAVYMTIFLIFLVRSDIR